MVIEPTLWCLEVADQEIITGDVKDQARADISFQYLNSRHTCNYIDFCIVSPTCQANANDLVGESVTKKESRKNKNY